MNLTALYALAKGLAPQAILYLSGVGLITKLMDWIFAQLRRKGRDPAKCFALVLMAGLTLMLLSGMAYVTSYAIAETFRIWR